MTRRCGRCDGEHHAQGLCKVHYNRAVRRELLPPSYASPIAVAVLLRRLMDAGWSQALIAREANVARNTIADLIRCRHRVRQDTARRIADLCRRAAA